MNKIFRIRILHLKGVCCPEDFLFASCSDSTSELLNPSQAARRIPQTMNASQPDFLTPTNRTDSCFKRDLNPCKAEGESDSPLFSGISRNWGGLSFTCDARPHSPRIIFRSRKPVVGSGLLVHLDAPIAELFKTYFFHPNPSQNQQNLRLQSVEDVIGLFVFAVLVLGTSLKKFLAPGNMFVLGTLGGSYE